MKHILSRLSLVPLAALGSAAFAQATAIITSANVGEASAQWSTVATAGVAGVLGIMAVRLGTDFVLRRLGRAGK